MPNSEDLRFLYDQARRYVTSRPWERLALAPLLLDLKVGSWHALCAEHVGTGPTNALLLFPGDRTLVDWHRAGLAELPEGTIFVELVDDAPSDAVAEACEYGWPDDLRPIPGFQTMTPDGWMPLERTQTRLLAMALAAITHIDSVRDGDPTTEVAGELTMPAAVRGRYRTRRAPAPDENLVPIFGMPRHDLSGANECRLGLGILPPSEYQELRAGARAVISQQAVTQRDELIPLVTISGSPDAAAGISAKLCAAEPLGIAFGEMDDGLSMILVGRKESYVLLEAREEREQVMLWAHAARSSGVGYAVIVEEAKSDQFPEDPTVVHAVFECRSAVH